MDVKPKYTEAGYDIDEDFVDSIQQFDIRTGQKIAEFIQNNINDIINLKLLLLLSLISLVSLSLA